MGKRVRASLLLNRAHFLCTTGEGVHVCLLRGGLNAWNVSSCNGVKPSSASDSVTQSDDTPSRYLPLYPHRATPEALTIVLLSIGVYMGAAATESPLSPKSTPHAICANSSSIGCHKSDECLENGLWDTMETVLVRVFRPSISMTALNP